MPDSNEKVLDRIKKLLALSENNDSPEEAALAAARAATLMEKHSIAEAELDGGGEEDVVETTFGVPGSHRSGELKQKSTWQGELASTIAPAFGCAVVWRSRHGGGRSRLIVAGRPADVEAAIVSKDFCHREIDRLTAKHAGGMGRSFGISFRMGCVDSIRVAIERERIAARAAARNEMLDRAEGGGKEVNETALVIVDTRAEKAMESFGKVRSSRPSYSKDLEAYFAGRDAGQAVWGGTKRRIEG